MRWITGRGHRIFGMAAGGALLAATALASGTAGTLDAWFGAGGVVLTPMGPGFAHMAVVQPDGRILTVGQVGNTGQPAVCRHVASGALDPSFGSGGVVILDSLSNGGGDLVLLADGRILVPGSAVVTVGTGKKATPVPAAAVARLTTSGALDPSFGNGGIATLLPTGAINAAFTALRVRPDGRIVAGGRATLPGRRGGPQQQALLLGQFTGSGLADGAFGSGGLVVDDRTPANDYLLVNGLRLQSQGSVVVGCVLGSQRGIRRYLPSGAADAAFGTIWPTTGMHRLAVDAADRILAVGAGVGEGSLAEVAIARFLPDGAVDGSFGSGGVVLATPDPDQPAAGYAPAFQADGKIVVPVRVDRSDGVRAHVLRLTDGGAPDVGFGTGGFTTQVPATATVHAIPEACAVAPDGGLLLLGTDGQAASAGVREWFLARYLGN